MWRATIRSDVNIVFDLPALHGQLQSKALSVYKPFTQNKKALSAPTCLYNMLRNLVVPIFLQPIWIFLPMY